MRPLLFDNSKEDYSYGQFVHITNTNIAGFPLVLILISIISKCVSKATILPIRMWHSVLVELTGY